ncbi:MAG: hypothetical protein QNJ16_00835 [Rhodobacter sp.]|nr:hypothetical protein [Rhodobacter sp.]
MAQNYGFGTGGNVALNAKAGELFVYLTMTGSVKLTQKLDLSLFIEANLPDKSIALAENDYMAVQYTYQPTITPKKVVNFVLQDTVFEFGAGRAAVAAAFIDLIKKIEAIEGKYVTPGAVPMLRAHFASITPATFAESLLFNYSFVSSATPPQAYVDLYPGMRLRMAPQFNQLIPGGPPQVAHGYVSAGEVSIEVVSTVGTAGEVLGFDGFLSSLAIPSVDAPPGGAGGLIDFRSTAFRRRHLRICYPGTFPPGNQSGSTNLRNAAAILGADTLADLDTATGTYYAGGDFAPEVSTGFFRGRTVLIPEVLVFVNGQSVYVPIGTTARDLLSRYSMMPRLKGLSVVGFHNKYVRYIPTLANAGGLNGLQQSFAQMYIADSAEPNVASQDVYDFPVLAGDAINVTNA